MRAPKVVSLFAGAGGMDLGFVNSGYSIAWANEYNGDACTTYRNNIGDHIHQEDIHKVPSSDIPDADVIVGGPPCQGFSVAGKSDPKDPRSALLWQFVRVVTDKQPRCFVMENVKALGAVSKWEVVRLRLVSYFQSAGYNVAFNVLDCSRYGVPQRRQRVFFIGVKGADANLMFPHPSKTRVTVRQALAGLPAYGEPGNDTVIPCKIVPTRTPCIDATVYSAMLFNGRGRYVNLDAPSLTVTCCPIHTHVIDQHELNTGEVSWVVRYYRDLHAGGTPVTTVPAHLRRLTVEEVASLQTFPSWYRFHGSVGSRLRQVGNAVPPVMAGCIASRIREVLFEGRPPDGIAYPGEAPRYMRGKRSDLQPKGFF